MPDTEQYTVTVKQNGKTVIFDGKDFKGKELWV